ncbi:MAG: NAD(P)-dependent oxidoreductase [Rhodocyclaceae bacterium]
MPADTTAMLRADCLTAIGGQQLPAEISVGVRIAVTGGTGFLGSWIAETVAALNDEHKCGITLDLYSHACRTMPSSLQHLAGRSDILIRQQDVRSPFEFHPATTHIIHAAGLPDNRLHASDPVRVFQTIVSGMNNVLNAAVKLPALVRLVNVSSGLVSGDASGSGRLREEDLFACDFSRPHAVYPEAKRAAENLCAVYASQFRLPVSTVRPFTFLGPYQNLDRPWAVNDFLRGGLHRGEIRVHGDGSMQRSYLYGSDAAWWLLNVMLKGRDGRCYNLGSEEAIRHADLAALVASLIEPRPRIVMGTLQGNHTRAHDFLPDVSRITAELGLRQTCQLADAVQKTIVWNQAC